MTDTTTDNGAALLALLGSRAGQAKSGKVQRPGRTGGWRGSPNSLAALEACGVPWSRLRKCRCGQPAVRGSNGCRRHGGAWVLEREERGAVRSRLMRRVRNLEERGLVPSALMVQPVYRDARKAGKRGAVVVAGLLAGWSAGAAGDPEAWPAALASARLELDRLAVDPTARRVRTNGE